MPRLKKSNAWKEYTTLIGVPESIQKQLSWDDLKFYFKLKLWDKSHICGICGKEIVRLDCASLDHILPKHYGGQTRENNLRLAHHKCNSSRNHQISSKDFITSEQLIPLKRYTSRPC